MEIKKIGVVGCGVMGRGIAQVCAQSGYNTIVSEINEELLEKGLASINAGLTRSVEKGRISLQEKESTLAHLKGATKLADFSDCDLVIEAVPEKMELKKQVFSELDKILPKQSIIGSNTSVLSIIDMAIETKRPDRVLGMHFFSPVPAMKLLELVKAITTSDQTIEIIKNFARSIGKVTVVAKDEPGFIVNRMLVPFGMTAIRLLEAGVASRDDIDNALKLGLNHPMGVLEMMDMAGLDTVYYNSMAMYEELKDPTYYPPTMLRKKVKAGWLGRKTGKGFYDYSKEKT